MTRCFCLHLSCLITCASSFTHGSIQCVPCLHVSSHLTFCCSLFCLVCYSWIRLFGEVIVVRRAQMASLSVIKNNTNEISKCVGRYFTYPGGLSVVAPCHWASCVQSPDLNAVEFWDVVEQEAGSIDVWLTNTQKCCETIFQMRFQRAFFFSPLDLFFPGLFHIV